jgi:hypothetical protein
MEEKKELVLLFFVLFTMVGIHCKVGTLLAWLAIGLQFQIDVVTSPHDCWSFSSPKLVTMQTSGWATHFFTCLKHGSVF